MANKNKTRWLVRVETRERGYLKVSSRHHVFKTENGAWNFVENMKKKHPECVCYIGLIEEANIRQTHLNLSETVGPDGLDF